MDLLQFENARVVVVGAGPVGLHIAGLLAEEGASVTTVHAGPLTHPHLLGVGPVAAGLIEPVAMADEDAALVSELCEASVPAWLTSEPGMGVDRRSVRFRPGSDGVPAWVRQMPLAEEAGDGTWVFRSVVVTPKIWLPAKVRSLRTQGVRVVRRHVADLDSLFDEFDIVVNCSGPGAWALGDKEMFGSRAVLLWARANVSEVRFDDERFLYGIPQRDLVGFGGTNVPVTGDPAAWDRTPTDSEISRLIDGAHDLYPELKRIDVLAVTCNYRPCRPRLRLEVESRSGGLVLHIAGLGGSGWTLAPGIARRGASELAVRWNDGRASRTA